MSEPVTSITTDEFSPGTFRRLWGVKIVDYVVNGQACDFESLVVRFAMNRATSVEGEVRPLEKIVRDRNAQLTKLGNALSDLSAAQTTLSPQDTPPDSKAHVSDTTVKLLQDLTPGGEISPVADDGTITKAQVERAIQMVKTEMDRLNNESSRDMSRLQSLVDKRDESYSNASSLMQSISGCRDSAIRNMA